MSLHACSFFALPENEWWVRDLRARVRCCFHCPVQEQQKESAKLRARVAQAAIERSTLVAEVKACDSSLNAQTVRVPCVLRRLGWVFRFIGVIYLFQDLVASLLSVM